MMPRAAVAIWFVLTLATAAAVPAMLLWVVVMHGA